MAKESYHIIANPDGGWAVTKTGAVRATRTFATKAEAVKCGRNISRDHSVELIIHRKDGRISERNSYGNGTNSTENTANN
jgi:hypothetical protein